MALFRCIGNRISTDVITLNYESGNTSWNANVYGEASLILTKKISPIEVELFAKRTLGTATWAGSCTTKFKAYNVKTNTWEKLAEVKDSTKTIDVSAIAKNKFYSRIKIEVGGTSSNGSVNHLGYAKIKKYYVK